MFPSLPLAPEQASTLAPRVDALTLFLLAVSAFFIGIIFLGLLVFAVRYRRRSEDELPKPILGSLPLELSWSLGPLAISLVIFVWGARLYYEEYTPPADAMEIYAVGKQWMWHTQHPEGQREINELHVPVGRPIKVTLTSEDVIHDFSIPAFRTKHDVIPGRYTNIWFNPTKPGVYHLFCSEYCGSQHSAMVGWVYVMEPAAYEAWLSGANGGGGEGSMASQGEKLFGQHGCSTCHQFDTQGRCPNLRGIYGRAVELNGGQTVVADEAYLRESILNPAAKIVYGYANIMPPYQGQITEEGVLQIIAYIKSMTRLGNGESQGVPDRGGRSNAEPGVDSRDDDTTKFRRLGPVHP